MADIFGLDFGTTNSLASRVATGADGELRLRDYDQDGYPHPSAVAYQGDRPFVGREAYQLLDQGEGGITGHRSPKSLLGTGERPNLGGIVRSPAEMVSAVIGHVLSDARNTEPALRFTDAVMTIPVDLDGRGRLELREAARDAGLSVHQFVHEPLAALYAYLRPAIESRSAALGESPILVVDWGGGTLDLTLVRIRSGTLFQFFSQGEHRVGGDRFDEKLRDLLKQQHFKTHGLTSLDQVQDGARQRLLIACETAKKRLSDQDSWPVFVPNYVAVPGDGAHVNAEVTRAQLEAAASPFVQIAMERIDAILAEARVEDVDLGLVLLVGGMSRMPLIRSVLRRRFGVERVPDVADADRLIAHGAAWIAHDRRRLKLAKPVELLLADDHPAALLPEGTALPVDEQFQPETFPVYCVNPRSGHARFVLTRPRDPGRAQVADPRRIYGTLQLPVRKDLGPNDERLDLDVVVDANLIVTVTARSELSGRRVTRQIHELEFGLGIGDTSSG